MSKLKVEENLATPQSFNFYGVSCVTTEELPSTDCCWPDTIPSNHLIQVEQGMKFGIQWTASGCLVPLLKCSKWKIQLLIEKWGQEEFLDRGQNVINVPYVPVSGHVYTSSIEIPAGTMQEGVYDIVAVIRLLDNAGKPLPVAGFAELGKFEFYQAS